MERGRPNNENEDNKTVPIFASSESPSSSPGAEVRPSNSTQVQSPVPERTSEATHRADFPSAIEPGAILLGKYRVIQKIGEGGMGSVWLVQHLGLDEHRALKVISEGIAGDSHVRARFDQEARILAKLKHANAVTVHDTGIVGDSAYIEMEYIDGVSLRRHLKRGQPSNPSFILWLMRGICDVLGAAHNRGIVHRDLKPENIMVVADPETGRQTVKVLDFGIAKIIHNVGDASSSTMHTVGVLGTPAYSSPEQNGVEMDASSRSPVDHRSDIYSLGVMLYELLTGELPFKGDWTQLLYQHARAVPKPPSLVALQAQIPPAVENLVLRCLEKTPDQRPGSAAELYNALRAAYGDVAGEDLDTTTSGPQSRKSPLPLLTPHPNATLQPTLPDVGRRARPTRRVVIPLALAAIGLSAALLFWLNGAKVVNSPPPLPPAPPQVAGVSPEVVEYLAQHYGRRVYKPDPGAGTVEIEEMRWPASIVREDDEHRKLRLHDRIYLPEGSEPETSEDTKGALRLPRLVVDKILRKPVRFRLIEGGTFEMGDDSPELKGGAESPSHKVSLHTYYIQEKETTIGEIDDYIASSGRSPKSPEFVDYLQAKSDLGIPVEENLGDYPAVSLSRKFCESYAHDLGGELPTEAQWEFAARSRGARKRFVWEGDEIHQEDANILSTEARTIKTRPVGRYLKDQTMQGVYDLAGNAREWCRDVWKHYINKGLVPDPVATSADTDPDYVIRGGSYETSTEMARTTYRSSTPDFEYKAKNNDAFPDVGFRLVLEVVIADLKPVPSPEPPTKKGPVK
ncbi:MAG: bifunctional serine/threonine-protein kinase/formylglycine-generating enzyme family protein [Paludisphaera borealis]|uniref:bifunctional serine/threonine-protein kinase/formylglycine-generating enzyme family protein n=1 Tax=Paludisphaera borealis TaxID=1387353 RepID=UPI002850110C|nr:bifunctional serine/threonine-protein kinase/formylglycine-generating enzyme family protein [Paludisphaera borealis]MDR3618399.1 bifunctional serine/threonine-protein kinase/formylglycine-generating enzyme family protein [Paludisphaera borealis]